jgi:hypothetical protein
MRLQDILSLSSRASSAYHAPIVVVEPIHETKHVFHANSHHTTNTVHSSKKHTPILRHPRPRAYQHTTDPVSTPTRVPWLNPSPKCHYSANKENNTIARGQEANSYSPAQKDLLSQDDKSEMYSSVDVAEDRI